MTCPVTAEFLLKTLTENNGYSWTGDPISIRDLRTMAHRVKTQIPGNKGINTNVEGDTLHILVVDASLARTRIVNKTTVTEATGEIKVKRPRLKDIAPKEAREIAKERQAKVVTQLNAVLLPDPDFNQRHRQRWADAMVEHGVDDPTRLPSQVIEGLNEFLRKEWTLWTEARNTKVRIDKVRLLRQLRILHGEESEEPEESEAEEDDEEEELVAV